MRHERCHDPIGSPPLNPSWRPSLHSIFPLRSLGSTMSMPGPPRNPPLYFFERRDYPPALLLTDFYTSFRAFMVQDFRPDVIFRWEVGPPPLLGSLLPPFADTLSNIQQEFSLQPTRPMVDFPIEAFQKSSSNVASLLLLKIEIFGCQTHNLFLAVLGFLSGPFWFFCYPLGTETGPEYSFSYRFLPFYNR